MRFLAFGATGRTGREVISRALDAGHHVTAFVRDASDHGFDPHPQLSIAEGEATELASVRNVLDGEKYDAVFSLLGPKTPIFSAPELVDATRNIVSAMEASESDRLIHLSIVSTRTDSEQLGVVFDLFAPVVARNLIREHTQKEDIITSSALEWTIFQPPFLTEDEPEDDYIVRDHVREEDSDRKLRLSRGNLAEAMLARVDDVEAKHKKLFITE